MSMNKEEAMKIIELYRTWNEDQRSISAAFGGPRTDADDVYDARRRLLVEATRVLSDDTTQEDTTNTQ